MRPRDILLAVAVAAVWGVNFVMIHIGLDALPPILFSTLRFTVAAVPALLFVGRPTVRWRWILTIAGTLAVVKFSLLFAGMKAGMPPGLSSLVLQSQAIFTVFFAVVLLRERPSRRQVVGLAVAATGLVLVAYRLGPDRPAGAFALVVASAVAWGVSNVVIRRASPADMLNFMVWVSAVAAPVLAALSLVIDGPTADLAALRSLDLTSLGALAYVAILSTLAGFGIWGALIRRHGAATVAPFSMLVPIFGIASSAVFLGETVHTSDVVAAGLVIGGVLLGAVRRAPAPAAVRPGSRPAAAGPGSQPAAVGPGSRPAVVGPGSQPAATEANVGAPGSSGIRVARAT